VSTEYFKRGSLLSHTGVRVQVGDQPLTAWQNLRANRKGLIIRNVALALFIGVCLWIASAAPDMPPGHALPPLLAYVSKYYVPFFIVFGLMVAALDVWTASSTYAWSHERLASRNAAEVAKLDPDSRHAIHKMLSLELENKGAFFVD
jgi:hypothetical protein